MYTEEPKKIFSEPTCEVTVFSVEDILTTSDGLDEDWGLGEV